ncbi:MAG: hypothetical protein RLZZ283_379 [Candidatus Parcubacteria bacterium]|jgi:peptidoglycan hydrolase-like protein with peptidoglycan-binding domain
MNNTTTLQRISHAGLYVGVALVALLSAALFQIQYADAAITSSLDVGSTGAQVTELQTYLATDASIYPQGLVTGYYGALTQAAVQRFQAAQGIVSSGTPETTGYGRVGPTTRARINGLLGTGNPGSNITWDTVPVLSVPVVQQTNTSATYTWTTNEPTRGEVFWDTAAIVSNEATGPRQQPYVSGTLALDAGGLSTNHSITVSNLQANTLYNYLVRSIDAAGNTSMQWPMSFRTNN